MVFKLASAAEAPQMQPFSSQRGELCPQFLPLGVLLHSCLVKYVAVMTVFLVQSTHDKQLAPSTTQLSTKKLGF